MTPELVPIEDHVRPYPVLQYQPNGTTKESGIRSHLAVGEVLIKKASESN